MVQFPLHFLPQGCIFERFLNPALYLAGTESIMQLQPVRDIIKKTHRKGSGFLKDHPYFTTQMQGGNSGSQNVLPIHYNLAVRLAPDYGATLRDDVIALAVASKENIKRMNIKPQYLSCDNALLSPRGAFNWITGDTI